MDIDLDFKKGVIEKMKESSFKKIMLFGSRSINFLTDEVKAILFAHMYRGDKILIGDCIGLDYSVQKFLFERNYPFVMVYTSGYMPRHIVDKHWPVKAAKVKPEDYESESEYFRVKDMLMLSDCDEAIAIWNGESRASKNNIDTLIALNKSNIVFIYPQLV